MSENVKVKITEDMLSSVQKKILDRVGEIKAVAANVGTGKTIASLYLAQKHGHKTVLVVVPKMLRDLKTWEQDLDKTTVDISMTVLSKEDFKKRHKELPVFDLVVFDEAGDWLLSGVRPEQKSKHTNPKLDMSQIYESVLHFVGRTKPKEIVFLDATISSGKPLSLWAMLNILGKTGNTMEEILESHKFFVDSFYTEIPMGYSSRWKERTVPSRYVSKEELENKQEEIKMLWRDNAIFLDDDRKIPPIEEDIAVEFGEAHKLKLETLKKNFAGGSATSRSWAFESGHYRDMSFDDDRHSMYLEDKSVVTEKDKAIADFVSFKSLELGGIIIFSTFTTQQHAIQTILKDTHGIDSSIINGCTESHERSDVVSRFRNGRIPVLIIQSSICAGYNMPECSCIVRASSPIKAAHLTQQYGRIDRAPNYKQNYIYNFFHKGGEDEKAHYRVKSGEDLTYELYDE